jgi:DNA-binding Lrp family transcriptional regulator
MLQESRLALPEAFVLLNCETGEEGDVIKELRAISGVSDVKVVFGIYDIIATLSADTDGDIKQTVAKIRMIGGIRSSVTMMVVQEYYTR